MEAGRVKAIAMICLVLWMIVGQCYAASKCYDDCYGTCLVQLHDPIRCQFTCKVQCAGTPPKALIDSCKATCAFKFCGDQNLEVTKRESCVEGCSEMCNKS